MKPGQYTQLFSDYRALLPYSLLGVLAGITGAVFWWCYRPGHGAIWWQGGSLFPELSSDTSLYLVIGMGAAMAAVLAIVELTHKTVEAIIISDGFAPAEKAFRGVITRDTIAQYYLGKF